MPPPSPTGVEPAGERDVGRPTARRVWLLLGLIVLAGAALRVGYALPGLSQDRFWDERYNFDNVRTILETGSLYPERYYYPSPIQSWPQAGVLAASRALHRVTGSPRLAVFDAAGVAQPTAYLLCRLVSVLYGAAALVVLFLVGRRMFSPTVGLVAALALAFTPWHLHASAKFKPDALLVLAVLLAFLWSLRVLERATAGRIGLAGLGVALAMSAKLTGGVVALPLALAAVWKGPGWGKRLGRLLQAGVGSLVLFLVLNPYARWYPAWLAQLQEDYAMRARWQEMSRWDSPLRTLELLLAPAVHGPLLGAIALLALALLAASLLRGRRTPEERGARSMLILFVAAYPLAYALSTPYFKANNLLPVVPFTVLGAAWLLVECGRRAGARLGRGARWAAAVAAPALVLALVTPGVLYVYRSLVPTTLDAANRFVGKVLEPAAGRTLFREELPVAFPPWEKTRVLAGGQAAVLEVDRLDRLSGRRLGRSDGEIFLLRRLEGEGAEFYRRRMEGYRERQVRVFRPRLFELRGPALVAIRHRQAPRAPTRRLRVSSCSAAAVCFESRLPPEVARGEWISLGVWVPFKVVGRDRLVSDLEVGDRRVPLTEASRNAKAALHVTERLRVEEPGAALRFTREGPRHPEAKIGITLSRWQLRRSPEE